MMDSMWIHVMGRSLIADSAAFGVGETVVVWLLHSLWIGTLLAVLVSGLARCQQFSVTFRYWTVVAAMVLVPCLPALFMCARQPADSSSSQTSLDLMTVVAPRYVPPVDLDEPIVNVVNESPPTSALQASMIDDEPVRLRSIRFIDLVLCVYIGGVLLMLHRLGRSITAQAQICSMMGRCDAGKLDPTYARVYRAAARARAMVGLHRFIHVGVAERVTAAMVVGGIRPAVLINVSLATGLTPRQLEQILVHEFAHIKRHDTLVLLGQRLIESLLFFNPAVWYISRQVSELRELCCDQWVVRHFDPLEYAGTLVECAGREFGSLSSFSLAAVGPSASGLRRRIGILLKDPISACVRRKRRAKIRYRSAASISLLLTGCLLLLIGFAVRGTNHSSSATIEIVEPKWAWIIDDGAPIDVVQTTLNSQHVSLLDSRPQDLVVKSMIDSTHCRYGECQFGDARSAPVAIVVELADGKPRRVFLDLDRDRTIVPSEEAQERDGAAGVWQSDLDVEIVREDERLRAKRRVAISMSRDRSSAYLATLGYAEGELQIGDATFDCRRFDNDGDGIALASTDDILIDLNQDQQFDVVTERFSPAPWITIADERFSVQSDSFGQELRLKPIEAMGQIEFHVALADANAEVVQLQGILRERQGYFVSVRLDGRTLELAPGDYCLEQLVTTVRDGQGRLWKLCQTQALHERWISLKANEQFQLDLFSSPRLIAESSLRPGYGGRSVTALEMYLIDKNGLVITDFERLDGEPREVEFQVTRPDLAPVEGVNRPRRCVFQCGRLGSLTLGDPRESVGSWSVESFFDSGPFFGEVRDRAEIRVDSNQ